jgi:hypothetical protein
MRLSTLTKLCIFLPLIAYAKDEFTVYTPKYRATEELVGLAESAFGNKANFSSLNGKVVINASPKTTASVMKLFADIDQIARQFKISFRLVARAESSGNSIFFKNGQISVGKKTSVGGTLAADSGQSESRKDAVQSARLMEGVEAQMALGNSWFPGGFSAKARGGTEDLVTVEFRQREAGANPALSLQSEVLMRLGEWKTVGEVSQSSNNTEKAAFGHGSNQGNETKSLQVKVELVK